MRGLVCDARKKINANIFRRHFAGATIDEGGAALTAPPSGWSG